MDDMVRRYVILRIREVTAVAAIGLLVILLSYLLPMSPLRVFLRLALLLGGLVWIFGYLKAAALSFFLAALMALLLFQVPLHWYVDTLFKQAKSPAVFMIVLFGGTHVVVSRQDLLEAVARAKETAPANPEQTRLENEAEVFCLLRRFNGWIQRTFASNLRRGIFLLPLALANVVSSATAVVFFKSLWAPNKRDFLTHEEDRALAAGILCLCITGVLVLYADGGRLMSGWWLFFSEVFEDPVAKRNAELIPKWPMGVYL